MNRGLEPGTRPRLFRVTALIGEGYGHDDNEGDAVGRRDRDGRSLHGTRLRDPGEQRDLMRAANIQAFWQGAFDMGLKEAMLETIDLDEHGDTAIETSRYALTADDGSVADHGTYIVIWKNDGGTWKVHRDIFNTSQPAA